VRELAKTHRVRTIVNLQQDKDMQYWNVDFRANEHACRELGMDLVRRPVSTGPWLVKGTSSEARAV
jgi:hypothetical protein